MRAEWDDLVVALQQSELVSLNEVDMEAVADDLAGEDLDAEGIALSAWRMAATPHHSGSCMNRGDASDGYYENPCVKCRAILVAFGSRVIERLEGGSNAQQ